MPDANLTTPQEASAQQVRIRNLFHLFSYAFAGNANFGKLAQTDGLGTQEFPRIADLLGSIVSHGVGRLLRRGLHREYVAQEETLAGIRGRIDFNESIRRLTFPQAKIHCQFEELSHDVLHNQLLKAAIKRLISKVTVPNVRTQLLRDLRRFGDVSDIKPTLKDFDRVQIHRNNHIYRYVLDTCRFALENQLLKSSSESSERTTHTLERLSEQAMGNIFESFARNFIQQHVCTRGESIKKWNSKPAIIQSALPSPAGKSAAALIPKCEIDGVYRRQKNDGGPDFILMECKFYSNHLSRDKLISSHLQQVSYYLHNYRAANLSLQKNQVDLLLLYAQGGAAAGLPPLDHSYLLHGHRLRVKTLDLNQDWQLIESDFKEIFETWLNAFQPIREHSPDNQLTI
jgi:5-methylcytosine-specific restriction enzyme subunit McrC